MSRQFDIIVYGASGFTGRLLAEYLTLNSKVSFAIAGRSRSKLDPIAESLQALNVNRFPNGVDIVLADSDDQGSLDAMVSQCRVVISTVGPFDVYGYPLVDACVRCKTDYIDITGEPQFIRNLVEKYHETAVKNQVLIVNSCGFDSIPSDIGTFMIADYFKSQGLETKNVRFTLKHGTGGVSGGTIASMCNLMKSMSFSELKQLVSNPDYLTNNHNKSSTKVWNGTTMYYDKGLKTWQSPFVMEVSNLRLVRRTNSLLQYGNDFQYCEGVSASNIVTAALSTLVMGFVALCITIPPFRYLLQKLVPPGTGPSKKVRESGFFDVRLFGEAIGPNVTVKSAKARVYTKGDPGYNATSKMVAESALCLLEKESFKDGSFKLAKGGIVTPASSMGMHLVERLRKAEMTLTVGEE